MGCLLWGMDTEPETCHECDTAETDTGRLVERDHPNPVRGTILLCAGCVGLYDEA